jgi:uncharacterized alpha-E superfamily protein
MERADGILRVLKINYAFSQDQIDEFSWRPVLRIFGSLSEEEISSIERNGRQVLQYMVLDRDNPNSVYNLVMKSRENARGVQDNLTKELWHCLNEYYLLIRDEQLKYLMQWEDPVSVLDSLVKHGMLYYGVADITMFRGEGWCFMNIGKYLERAVQSADILDVKFSDLSYDLEKTTDTTYWKYLLLSVSGYALYLKKYRSGFEAKNVVDQVLFNVDFPRSFLYSINQLHRNFSRLRSEQGVENFSKVDFMIGRLKSKVQYSTVDNVSRIGLHHYLQEITAEILEIGSAINQHYFAYS